MGRQKMETVILKGTYKSAYLNNKKQDKQIKNQLTHKDVNRIELSFCILSKGKHYLNYCPPINFLCII